MCRGRKPRLRAASKVRRSSAEPTPWLCQGFSTLMAASAWCGKRSAERPQFGRAAHHAVDEKAMHHGIERQRQIDVIADEVVGYAAAEPAAPAVAVEPQQVVAVFVGFADPQFADHAAFGKNFLHSGSPDIVVDKTLLVASSPGASRAANDARRTSNQTIMLCGAKLWQGEALSNMRAFRIRMACTAFATI